jgi:hypothetical protein
MFQKYYVNFWSIALRGATGAARAPKLDKTPNMVARRRCRRRNLFSKIKVRPRSCRSYPIWRPWPYCTKCTRSLKMLKILDQSVIGSKYPEVLTRYCWQCFVSLNISVEFQEIFCALGLNGLRNNIVEPMDIKLYPNWDA